jgi:hypothetical protein
MKISMACSVAEACSTEPDVLQEIASMKSCL